MGERTAARRPSLREVQRQASRQHLVGAARSVFEEKGYLSATIDDLIEAAGTSRATFYSHFSSKSELVEEIVGDTREEVFDVYRQLDAALEVGTRDAVREWIEVAIDWLVRHSRLMPAWQEANLTEPGVRETQSDLLVQIPNVMTNYLASRPPESRERAKLRIRLLVVQISAYFRRLRGNFPEADERQMLAEELTDIWYTVLAPRPRDGTTGREAQAK